MLNSYLAATSALLQNPAAQPPLYSTASLTTWINTARGQLATESESIRYEVTVQVTAPNQRSYTFAAMGGTPPLAYGVQGFINARTLWLETSNGGRIWLTPRTQQEFSLYNLSVASPLPGPPAEWAQFGQGVNGSIYIDPVPLPGLTLVCDVVGYPVALVDDNTVEAIPYQWTDAVPYFAAYLALLSAQTNVRSAEADKMLQRYKLFVERARLSSTNSILPWIYEQVPTMGGINPKPAPQGGG